jgi:mycothiol synthase
MRRVKVVHHLAAVPIDAVQRLAAADEAVIGARPLPDHVWLDLMAAGRRPSGDDGDAGSLAVLVLDDDRLVGYGQLAEGNGSSTLAITGARTGDVTVADAVLDAVEAELGGGGDATVHWVVVGGDDEVSAVAHRHGYLPGRTLLQLRVPLPLDPSVLGRHVEVRGFRPGIDDDDWIAVNNAAFADHPEQGGWDRATLASRMAEPWFDPSGFVLHHRDGRLAAFCWTKVHPAAGGDPRLGEIYAIAVHPDFHGIGLGRSLTVAGLAHLHGAGISTGMLYVDQANEAALGLYLALGFTVHRADHVHVRHVRSQR